MKLARWIFLVAGIYGVVVLTPGFFLERVAMAPAALAHPEFYYGFYGSALVWQFLFLAISRNPLRYQPLMLIGALEKLAFFATCLALYFTGRLEAGGVLLGALLDGVWMLLFLLAWWTSSRASGPAQVIG
jgi:hypothetical protein